MSLSVSDPTTHSRLTALGERVLSGGEISRADADWLFSLEAAADIMDLLAWSNRIRERFHGHRVHLCSIVNAKAGGCPEDCRFCAQSAAYHTESPRHGFIDAEEVRQAAFEAKARGVGALGIVAAWKGMSEGPLLDEVCERFRQLAGTGLVRPDASLGILRSQAVADRLRAAGVVFYNHNLETSRRFYPQVCTTHSYDDRLQTLRFLRQAGIRLCCGGIIGLGEERADRCDLAFALRELGVEKVPINVLNPIAGTPFAHVPPLPPLEILKTIACFRFILPQPILMLAGGRTVNLRDAQCLIFAAGTNGLMVGNFLTTMNQPVERDLQMIRDLGLVPVDAAE